MKKDTLKKNAVGGLAGLLAGFFGSGGGIVVVATSYWAASQGRRKQHVQVVEDRKREEWSKVLNPQIPHLGIGAHPLHRHAGTKIANHRHHDRH